MIRYIQRQVKKAHLAGPALNFKECKNLSIVKNKLINFVKFNLSLYKLATSKKTCIT